MAGAQTTGKALVTLCGHFATAHESVARIRREFDSVCQQSEEYDAQDIEKLSTLDYLQKYVSYEST